MQNNITYNDLGNDPDAVETKGVGIYKGFKFRTSEIVAPDAEGIEYHWRVRIRDDDTITKCDKLHKTTAQRDLENYKRLEQLSDQAQKIARSFNKNSTITLRIAEIADGININKKKNSTDMVILSNRSILTKIKELYPDETIESVPQARAVIQQWKENLTNSRQLELL